MVKSIFRAGPLAVFGTSWAFLKPEYRMSPILSVSYLFLGSLIELFLKLTISPLPYLEFLDEILNFLEV